MMPYFPHDSETKFAVAVEFTLRLAGRGIFGAIPAMA